MRKNDDNESFIQKSSENRSRYDRFAEWMNEYKWWWLFLWAILFIVILILFIVFVSLWASANTYNVNTYDYIVIGSGAGGAAVAYQLTQIRGASVLVIEAGPSLDDYFPVYNVPSAFPGYLEGNYFNELFWQNTQAGMKGAPGVDMYTGGRLGGGSTSINNLQYVQGSNWIWDWFYNASGRNPIWNSTNIIQNYQELQTLICDSCNPQNHGYSGPLSILEEMNLAPQTTPTTFAQKFVKAMSQMTGYPIIGDYNNMTDSNRLGAFTSYQLSAFTNGTRCSSTTGILDRLVRTLPSSTLKVIYNAFVTRIKFDGTTAKEVLYVQNGHITNVAVANKEIIVAAGVGSAGILLHSGIGEPSWLQAIGVKPRVALNPLIGQQMWNHQVYAATYTKNASDLPSANVNDLFEGGAFMPLPANFTFPNPSPIELGPRGFQFTAVNVPAPANLMALTAFNLQPQSIGNLFIRNNDPLRTVAQSDNLYIGPNGANDLAQVFALYNNYFCPLSKEYQGTGVGPAVDTSYVIIDPPVAVCNNATLLRDYVNNYMPDHTYHWTGSVPMGTDINSGVVDGLGRVFGTKNLRVADASIFGHPYDGNTQATAYQIGWAIGKAIREGLTH